MEKAKQIISEILAGIILLAVMLMSTWLILDAMAKAVQ